MKEKPYGNRLIKYDWILKNLPFFLYMALLAIVYIYNGHWADKTIRDINLTAKQVKNLQYEYKTLKSEEMYKSRESQIIQAATPLGLKVNESAPMRIIINNTHKP